MRGTSACKYCTTTFNTRTMKPTQDGRLPEVALSAHRVENPVGQLLPLQLGFDAQRRCRLSRAGIPIARELGANPRKFEASATENDGNGGSTS